MQGEAEDVERGGRRGGNFGRIQSLHYWELV